MGRFLMIAVVLFSGSLCANDVYAPLRLYQGTWRVRPKEVSADTKPDQLIDECSLVGKYFACQQTVNGKPESLIVFVPADAAGHYYTNSVDPAGRAGGRGELEISGERWVYQSKEQADGNTIYHRTVNVFTGKDRIHYEIAESSDGEHWTEKRSGDEVRVNAARHK